MIIAVLTTCIELPVRAWTELPPVLSIAAITCCIDPGARTFAAEEHGVLRAASTRTADQASALILLTCASCSNPGALLRHTCRFGPAAAGRSAVPQYRGFLLAITAGRVHHASLLIA